MVEVKLVLTNVTPRQFWDECAKAMAAEGMDLTDIVPSFEDWAILDDRDVSIDHGYIVESPFHITRVREAHRGSPVWMQVLEFTFAKDGRGWGCLVYSVSESEGVA